MKNVTFSAHIDTVSERLINDYATVPPEPQSADAEGAMPAELRRWLVQLRLLQSVPFAYLVPDTELLPEESIRWFYVDREWTDALVMGALSVGTANSDDRTLLTGRYPAVRDELDREERQVRRPDEAPRLSGDGGPISGFILRSRLVAGWPAMHVRAFAVDPNEADDASYSDDDPRRIRLLRLERLAPAVLLCLFDGIPRVVHIEEPRQGVQFGFDATEHSTPHGTAVSAVLRPRDPVSFEYLGVAPVPVRFRGGGSGVVNIKALEQSLPAATGGTSMDSAQYALQLIRRPYRQVFGDEKGPTVASVFQPTVTYQSFKSYVDTSVTEVHG
ncbi:MAG TPA: hypothetical protein VN088_02920 [Nocardioides sp.]|nr:hypothetical protein [Nocardioides sp.]